LGFEPSLPIPAYSIIAGSGFPGKLFGVIEPHNSPGSSLVILSDR